MLQLEIVCTVLPDDATGDDLLGLNATSMPQLQHLSLSFIDGRFGSAPFRPPPKYSASLTSLLLSVHNLQVLIMHGVLPELQLSFPIQFDFPSLKLLEISPCKYKRKSEQLLLQLLSHAPNIEKIHISFMAVTDEVFHRLLAVNNLLALEELIISRCAISLDAVRLLIYEAPEGRRRHVSCYGCNLITEECKEAIQQEGCVNGWKVKRDQISDEDDSFDSSTDSSDDE